MTETLDLRPWVNAIGPRTRWGGRTPEPAVLAAMAEASAAHLDVEALMDDAGRRLAALTRNEAALVCAGASSGLFLMTMAALTRGNPRLLRQQTDPTRSGPRPGVAVHRTQRSPVDTSVEYAGARFVEFGDRVEVSRTDLEAVIGEVEAVL